MFQERKLPTEAVRPSGAMATRLGFGATSIPATTIAVSVSMTDSVPGWRENALLTYARVPSGVSAMPLDPGPTPSSTVATTTSVARSMTDTEVDPRFAT